MIWQLMRRDAAWKSVPWLCTGAAAAALLCRTNRADAFLAGMAAPIYLLAFIRAVPHQRATFFEAALPVSGRDLWLARLLSLLAMTWLPVLAAAAMLGFHGYEAKSLETIASIGAALSLGVVIILSIRVRQFSGPAWLTPCYPVVGAALMVPAFVAGYAAAAAALCAIAAVVVGLQAWECVPESLQSAPLEPCRERRQTGSAEPSLPWWPVLRSVFNWRTAIFIPVSMIWIAMGDWLYGSMYLMIGYSQIRLAMQWTLGLPFSRRAALAVSAGPLLLVLALGCEVGLLSGAAKQAKDLVRQGDPDHFRAVGTPDVFVDRAFWRWAPDGRTPVIQAPWGETFQPVAERAVGVPIYNPYSVGEHNSQDFEDWQFARATSDIYGVPATPREMAEGKLHGLTPVTSRPRMQILSVAAILALALLWWWAIELSTWHRIGRLSARARTGIQWVWGSLLCAGLVIDLLAGRRMGSLSRPAIEAGLLALSRSMPSNLVVLALLALLPLAGLAWIVDRQAAAAEVTQKAVENQSIYSRFGGRP